MACPMSAFHLPMYLFFFLFPLSLSISSSSSSTLSPSTHNALPPKVMYVAPKQQPPVNRESRGGVGTALLNRVARSSSYNTYNTSGKDGGGDVSGNDPAVVHKLSVNKDGVQRKANGGAQLAVNSLWDVNFEPTHIYKLDEDKEIPVTLTTRLSEDDVMNHQVRIIAVEDDWVATVDPSILTFYPSPPGNQTATSSVEISSWSANFTVKGVFVGIAKIRAILEPKEGYSVGENVQSNLTSSTFLTVTVIRKNSWMDHAFTGSIAILVSVLFVNFGAALDWNVLRDTLKRPVGPCIGFVTQFLFMPVVGYVLGMLLFESPSMRLGLFFTGCSPGGGASNIWTFALGGNLPLSITMTTISTFASFGMMPFWLFTLGATIFNSAELSVPYNKIATFAIALVVPLALGFLLQRKWPRGANFLVRHILKPLCGFLLVFIVIFAIATNLYIFHLFSWKIILCGMGLPWLGFACGAVAARMFSLPTADILAIAIETGVQNTGIAIFMLRFTLGQPLADLTTVVPVSIAIMTPIPLFILWLYRLATGKITLRMRCANEEMGAERPLRESTVENINGTMIPIDRKV